jgi:hypothetical protein
MRSLIITATVLMAFAPTVVPPIPQAQDGCLKCQGGLQICYVRGMPHIQKCAQ